MNKHIKSLASGWALMTVLCAPALAAVDLTASMPVPQQPWYLNEVHDFTITITNSGTTDFPGDPAGTQSLYISIPLETELVTPLSYGCVQRPSASPQYIDCPLPAIPAGESTIYTLPANGIALYPTGGGNGLDLRVNIEFASGLGAQQFVGGPFYIDPNTTPPVGSVAPVPTLGHFGLALLSAGLAALGLRRKAKKKEITTA